VTGKLDVVHVHQLLRLVMEPRELSCERPGRDHHLVAGLVRLVGAASTSAVFDTGCALHADRQRSATVLIGWDDRSRRSLEMSQHAGRVFEPVIRAMTRITPGAPGAVVTATWRELVRDLRDVAAPDLEPSPAGVSPAHVLFSTVRLRTVHRVHGLGLYRAPEAPAFTPEERDLVHVFHAACEAALSASRCDPEDDDQVRAGLSRRERQTLALVLDGLADKEIAERLGISRHTVNQYTKAIYRHYAVTSRAQLLARLLAQPQSTHSLIVGN
jgi:DNA-binding CsgD family transcriptional regulator